jgi:transposase
MRARSSGRDRATGTVMFHPGYLAFCRDWDFQPRASAPYRARTKGKVESGVNFVKRNALAGRTFLDDDALAWPQQQTRTDIESLLGPAVTTI